MASLNKIILIGNLGRDPEIKQVGDNSVANFSIATKERHKSQTGEWQEKTEWHNIVVWGKRAETCGKYLSKGSAVLVVGKLRTRSWDDKNGGAKRYATEIWADDVQFLSKKEENSAVSQIDRGSPEAFKPDNSSWDVPF